MSNNRPADLFGDRTARAVNSKVRANNNSTPACRNKKSTSRSSMVKMIDNQKVAADGKDKALWEAVREIHLSCLNLHDNDDWGDSEKSTKSRELRAVNKVKELVKRGASVNGALALHRATANQFEQRILKLLVQLGGDVNLRDQFGATPLHQAAANHNDAIPWLVELGANKRAVNLDGKPPIYYLRKQWKKFVTMYREDQMGVPAAFCQDHLEYVLTLMPRQERLFLASGESHNKSSSDAFKWLSPRMVYQLLRIAEIEMDCFSDGAGNLSYIPNALFKKCGNNEAFLDGYKDCYKAIIRCLRQGKAPTVDRLKKCPLASIRLYLELGGKIEYAIDAIIDLGLVEYEDSLLEEDPDFLDLPETVLDDAFEIAKAMCIDFGGGDLSMTEKGPYASRYEDEVFW